MMQMHGCKPIGKQTSRLAALTEWPYALIELQVAGYGVRCR